MRKMSNFVRSTSPDLSALFAGRRFRTASASVLPIFLLQLFCNICWSDHIAELEEKLQALLKQLDECEERLNYKSEHLEIRCNHLKDTIAYTTEEKITKLKEAERKALEEVDKLKNDKQMSSQILQKHISDLKNNINEKFKNADSSQKVSVVSQIACPCKI